MLSLPDKILGTWAVAAGISLLFTFFRQYRGRPLYIYMLFFGCWSALWGYQTLRQTAVVPRFWMWAIFGLGVVTMLRDSARRYRETGARLRNVRVARLRDSAPKPPDDPPAG